MLLLRFHIATETAKYVDNPSPNSVILSKTVVNLIIDLTFFCLYVSFLHYTKAAISNGKYYFGILGLYDKVTHLVTKITEICEYVCKDLALNNKYVCNWTHILREIG